MPGENRGGFNEDGTYFHTPDIPDRIKTDPHGNPLVQLEQSYDAWNDPGRSRRRGKDQYKEKRPTGRRRRQVSRRFKRVA